MNSSIDKNKISIIGKIVIAGLLIFIFASIINRIFSSPFDYDEALGLIMAKIIYLTGTYSTYDKLFDPVITIGATVYFPIVLIFNFGNIFLPRLIIFAYSLLFIYIVTAKILKSEASKIIFLFLLCVTPYFFYFSSHVLGEVPAIFLSLAGLYLLSNKKYFLSGLFLMLSIFTKSIFLLSLVPAAYLLFIDRKELNIKKLIIFVTPFVLITAGWELYKLISFNFSIHKYYDSIYQLLRYNKGLTKVHFEYFFDRLFMLRGTFGINGIVMLFSLFSVSIISFFKSKSKLIRSLAIFTFIYLFYYFFLGSTSWCRHFFPAFILFVIVISDLAISVRKTFLSVIPAVILVGLSLSSPIDNQDYLYKQNLLPIFDQVGSSFLKKSDVLNQQIETANYVSTNIKDEKIAGFGWYNAPEISYITGKQIFKDPEAKDVPYLIRHPFGVEYDSVIVNYPNKKTLLETPLYKIYKKDD